MKTGNGSCRQIRKLIVLDAYREISPRESERLRKHLASCDGCRAEWERTKKTAELFAAIPSPALPEESLRRIKLRAGEIIAEGSRSSTFPSCFLKPALAIAAVLMLAGSMILFRSPVKREIPALYFEEFSLIEAQLHETETNLTVLMLDMNSDLFFEF